MKKLYLLVILILGMMLHNPVILNAQPPSFDNDTSDVPIDGGMSILLAMGIGYGIRKNWQQKDGNKKNEPAPNK